MRKLKMGELGRMSVDEFKRADKFPLVLILDNIRSLNNIGSIFRTADAFRIEKIYLTGFTARPPHKDIHKTALGATESVDWEYVEKISALLQKLNQEGFFIIALEQTDEKIMLQDFHPEKNRKTAVILGNEVKGISDEALDYADIAVEIPQFGTKHSLNVSVSAGIVLWDLLAKINFDYLCEK